MVFTVKMCFSLSQYSRHWLHFICPLCKRCGLLKAKASGDLIPHAGNGNPRTLTANQLTANLAPSKSDFLIHCDIPTASEEMDVPAELGGVRSAIV
jgi:hypothetical protein